MKIRSLILVSSFALMTPAQAQDVPKVIPVVFRIGEVDWQDRRLDNLIRETLSRTPGFNLMKVVTPDALVITISGGFGRSGHQEATRYDFAAVFSRNGNKIGESLEGCSSTNLAECADQIAADAQSVAGTVK
jgi:hypothetical protein